MASSHPLIAGVSEDLFNMDDTIQKAAYAGNLALVEMLRRKGFSVADDFDLDGRSAVHWASAGGHIHILEHMLSVDPSGISRGTLAADDEGWTPLHSAVSSGHVGVTAFLLENGADAAAVTKQGRTVLHYLKGSEPLAALVVSKLSGSNALNKQDNFGCTAMHRAATRGELEVVKLLLDHGGSATLQDLEGNTPLHSACAANEGNVALLLLRHEACSNIAEVRNKQGLTMTDVCATSALRRQIMSLPEIENGVSGKKGIA